MPMFLRVVLICCALSGMAWCQRIDIAAGFKALEEKNFGIARSVFYHELSSCPSVATYGLFRLYSESMDCYSMDSAWYYLHQSFRYFETDSARFKPKKLNRFEALGWKRSNLWAGYQSLAKLKFEVLSTTNNLQELTKFIETNPLFVDRKKAERLRDSLGIRYCDNRDYFCWLGLLKRSPESDFREDILYSLDAISFEEWVVDNTELELATFVKYHPNSRFVIAAQDELYRIFLQTQDTMAFKRFLLHYPLNRNKDKIWKAYFHASIGNYDPVRMTCFLALHPDYPFKDQVLQELNWYGKSLFPFANRDDLFGFMDEEGRLVVPVGFEEVNDFHEGLAAVMKNARYGVINTNGEVAVEFVFDLISDFQSGRAIVKVGNKYGVIDRNGKSVIPVVYDDLQFVFTDFILFQEDGLFGVMNLEGLKVLSAKFLEFLPLGDQYALVEDERGKGVLHASLEQLIPCHFDGIQTFKEGFIVQKLGKVGVVDYYGLPVVPCIYDEIIPTVFSYLTVRKDKKIFHIGTKDWRVATLPVDVFDGWKNLAAYNGSNFMMQRKGLNFWVDSAGKLSKAPKLPVIEFVAQTLVGNSSNSENLGIFDRKGNALTSLDFQDIQLLENGCMKVVKEGKVGLYDANGIQLLEPVYDELVYWPQVNLYLTEIKGKQGVVDALGKVLLENKYTSVKQYSQQYLALNLESQFLYFNFITGKIVKRSE